MAQVPLSIISLGRLAAVTVVNQPSSVFTVIGAELQNQTLGAELQDNTLTAELQGVELEGST